MSDNRDTPKPGRGCGFGCALAIGMFIGFGLLTAALVMGSLHALNVAGEHGVAAWVHSLRAHPEAGEDEAPNLIETWSSGCGEVKVVRIPLSGMIMLGDSSWYAGNAATALRAIRRAKHDPEVEGLILEINSGGGGITDSDILYQALCDFKASAKGRVVVSLLGDVAASGGYYVALASDAILAHPTTLTGSIGVLLQAYNIQELAAKIGIRDVTVKSGENKDLFNPFQEVKPAQREMVQKIITAMHERFVGLVAQNRTLPIETVRPLADGRVFLADEALRHKLIDGIGYQADAQSRIAQLLETDAVKVFRYDEQVTLMDLFTRPGIGLQADLGRFLREGVRDARLLYRWSW
ncbi:MAG: signal peptide peptidase SppA [Kiritimatiellia bacterium]|jgi:protease-4|nr:signal peptide peptidase SppA [Kiritimatiellia bacterium]